MWIYIISGLILLVILLLIIRQNMRSEGMVNLAETDSLCVLKSRNPKYPIYPYEKYSHQRRFFDSLTYDYHDDQSKKIVPVNACF